jgi:MFS family permease
VRTIRPRATRSRWLTRPRLDAYERRLLWLLGGASFFSHYDQGLLSILLVQIQTDLGIPEAQLGLLGSLVRLGALPAFACMLVADRFGRRRVLLATIVGYTVFTACTALARGFAELVIFQLLARTLMAAEFLLALVVVVEEFRPDRRGWGIGVLGTLALLGHGLSLLLFGFVEYLPFGWRGLYALGVAPLLVIGLFRRRLPETRRFTRSRQQAPAARAAWWAPIRAVLHRSPRGLGAVLAVTFLWSFSNAPVDFFLPKYMQEGLGWTAATFARLAVLGGALGMSGQLLAGWASDRVGRRPILLCFLVLEPVAAICLYGEFVAFVFPLYVAWVFASVSNDVVGRTVHSELFPTSHRATASGLLAVMGTLGSVLGLASEGMLYAALGSHWMSARLLAAAGLAMPLLVLLTYPETSGRTLEEIADEREGVAALPEPRKARWRGARRTPTPTNRRPAAPRPLDTPPRPGFPSP